MNKTDMLTTDNGDAVAFTFGEPESVLDRSALIDSLYRCETEGDWYTPPMSLEGLAKTFRAATHHSSPIYFKRNILASTFRPHRLFSKAAFARWALDFLVMGNAYLEKVPARSGTLKLEPMLARYTRRGRDLDTYYWLRDRDAWGVSSVAPQKLPKGTVHHLMEPDINQEIYGVPEYISALHATLLNEAATIFRRRYYKNGSHAGYILYLTDPTPNQKDVDALREALKNSKGPGNFKNLFFHSPAGKTDGLKLIPVAEVAAKDGFGDIKNSTRDDMLSVHRVPPQLMGILPNNTAGFGDVEKAARVFATNEIRPLQERMLAVNDWIGEEVIRFDEYELVGAGTTMLQGA